MAPARFISPTRLSRALKPFDPIDRLLWTRTVDADTNTQPLVLSAIASFMGERTVHGALPQYVVTDVLHVLE